VLAAVGALIGLFLFGVAAESFGRVDQTAATPAAVPPKGAGPAKDTGNANGTAANPPGLGDAVRDGKFEFVVSRADCSRSTVGLEHLNRTAAGRYCVVSLSVRNIADRPQLFLGRAQKAFDVAGAGYTSDEIAGLFANRETQTFLRKIDPGDRVVGKLVFDVPTTTTLTTVELHDSLFSGGVKVAVK
jgi:hypothetical protein